MDAVTRRCQKGGVDYLFLVGKAAVDGGLEGMSSILEEMEKVGEGMVLTVVVGGGGLGETKIVSLVQSFLEFS